MSPRDDLISRAASNRIRATRARALLRSVYDPLSEQVTPQSIATVAVGAVAVVLMLVWAVDNGGYDTGTWYWGALILLALSMVVLWARLGSGMPSRAILVPLAAFAGYVAWSYLSIAWAGSQGDALEGSNRALLYLLMFGVMALLPWTPKAALVALTAFALGVGAIGLVLLARLSAGGNVSGLFVSDRLAAPTGYINATAALFTIGALVSIALGARRELPGEIRGVLLAMACGDLQLAVIVQSRGWLFTLPLIALVGIVLVRDRLRVTAAAVLPVAGAAIPLHRLLGVFTGAQNKHLAHAAGRAGTEALIVCAVVLVVATTVAWAERLLNRPAVSDLARRRVGAVVVVLALAGFAGGGVAATHGHPFAFIKRQWNGFSHPTAHFSTQSHFGDVGSGRYDFWRVSLDAFVSHPIGGLGQDNFDNYYVLHRRTGEEPAWTHSLELRLLAHTGIVGFLLFAAFLVAAVATAARAIRGAPGLAAGVAAIALLPLVVWLIHGSLDWFWEMPALSGPALGFLGVAVALGQRQTTVLWARQPARRPLRPATLAAITVGLLAGVVVLGFPYLSARETAIAADRASTDPSGALGDLRTAADLDPLSASPGRLAGTIALRAGDFNAAESSFAQVVARDPGGWFGWFGEGLAASALGQPVRAAMLLAKAKRINSAQPIIATALSRVESRSPITPREALAGLNTAG